MEKLQAWLRFILENRVRGRHGWKQGALLAPEAGWGKWPRRCVFPLLTLGREAWMGKERKQQRVRAERWLICWCSSVVSGPRVTNHEIDFLEWGRLLGLHWKCGSFEVGPNACITHKQVSTLLHQKGLLWNISFTSEEKPEFRCIVLVYFPECGWRNTSL